MPAKLTTTQLDHAVELYLSGKATQEIPTASGVSLTRLYAELSRRSIPSRKRHTLPVEQIVTAYRSGASENALAAQYGVSRGTIGKRLAEAGVERRNASQSAISRAASMTTDERREQVKGANRGARMRRVPEIEKYRRALTVERQGRPGSEGEIALRRWLDDRGETPTVERAIGRYNVDLAMLPVAVEVLGGGWHGVKARHRERTPHILDSGWHLVMVWNHEGNSALGEGAADYLVALLDEIRRNPPATCQYRVISGQGKLLAARGREDNEFPLVPPPRGSL